GVGCGLSVASGCRIAAAGWRRSVASVRSLVVKGALVVRRGLHRDGRLRRPGELRVLRRSGWGLGLALVVFGSAVLVVPDAAAAGSRLWVDQVYARAARSLTGTGRVYHSVITSVGGSGSRSVSRDELWVDASRDVAREQVGEGSAAAHPILIVDGGSYEVPGH